MDKKDHLAASITVIGFAISLMAALVSWVPLIGVYGMAGVPGALLCLAAVWRTRRWARILAVLGILMGLGAAGGGLFWLDTLKHSGGHLF